MDETSTRSAAKALSWRVFASLTTMLIVYAFTGKLTLSLGIGAFDFLSKLVLYFAHERIWNRVRWGKGDAGAAAVGSRKRDR